MEKTQKCCFQNWEIKKLSIWIFEKIKNVLRNSQTVEQRTKNQKIEFLLEGVMLLFFQIANLKKIYSERNFLVN